MKNIQNKIERRLYYTSDIHHEMRGNGGSRSIEIIPLAATQEEKENGIEIRNFLALCGDIGNPYDIKYEEFLAKHSFLFEKIFVIAGNHEYYSNNKQRPMNKIDAKMKEVCDKFPNVFYLQKSRIQVDEVTIVGCTLWTQTDENAESLMNDYKKIYVEDDIDYINSTVKYKYIPTLNGKIQKKYISISKKSGFSVSENFQANRRLIRYLDILQFHGEMTDYLEEILQTKQKEDKISDKIIVLTHHAPSFLMVKDGGDANNEFVSKNKEREGNSEDNTKIYYASDCEYLFKKPLICWISGHTHKCIEAKVNNIPCLSNCYGYPNQKTGVNPQKYFVF